MKPMRSPRITPLLPENQELVERQWSRWYAGVEELWGLEHGQGRADLADHGLNADRRMESLSDFDAPWQDLPLGQYAAGLDYLLLLAKRDFEDDGVMIAGARAWRGLTQFHLRPFLTRSGMYRDCVAALDRHMGLSHDPSAHAPWLSQLLVGKTFTPTRWAVEFRAGGAVWKAAPALFGILCPADTGAGMRDTGRQSLAELSVMVEDNMRLDRCFKENKSDVRAELRRSKAGIRDYLEGYLATHPIDLDLASKSLNILGWLDRHKVRPPKITEEVKALLLRAGELAGPTIDDQRKLALVRLRRDTLGQMTQDTRRPEAPRTKL